MHSGSVNAALLLSSYLGKEHEKIGHGIARSDFAGELGKLFPQNIGALESGASVKQDTQSTDGKTALEIAQTASARTPDKSVAAQSQDQPSESVGLNRTKSASQSPNERLEKLKNRVKSSKKVYITNPVLLESIMAELQYPAETIKAFKNMQNQDGWISLKDFKDLVANLNIPEGTLGQGRISTAQAQALLAAIVQKADGSGTGRGNFASLKDSLASAIQQKTSGSFNIDEFKGLLGQVLQLANMAEVQKKAESTSSGTAAVSAVSAAKGAEIALQSTVTPKQGQSESLTSSILPSFLDDDSEDSGRYEEEAGKQSRPVADSASTGVDPSPETIAAAREVPGTEAFIPASGISDPSAAVFRADRAKSSAAVAGAAREPYSDSFAQDPTAQIREKSAAAATAASEPEDTAGPSVPEQTLVSLAEEFGATIVSTGADTPETTTANAAPQGDSRAAAAVQGQNLTPLAKETLKGSVDKISASELPATDLSETPLGPARIITQQAGETQDQSLPDYDPNRAAGLAQDSLDQARPTPRVKTGELSGAAPETAKSASVSQGAVTTDRLPYSGPGTAAVKETGLASASIINGPAAGDEGAQGSPSGESASSGQPWPESGGGTADRAAVEQKSADRMMEGGISIKGPELSGIAKDVEKQLKFGNSASDAALLTSSANRVPDGRIEMPLAQQTPGGGLNNADPGRMAEIIENFREQYRGVGGQQLVLDLEPGQFGKMSVKVGAKKGEVSAVVVTENESARQALLRNAPELRQSLDDQGLLLGKFQVDVDRDKAGAGNTNPDWQKSDGKTTDPAVESAGSGQTRQKPAYFKRNDLSQVSIFA